MNLTEQATPITAANLTDRLKAHNAKKKPDEGSSVDEQLAYTRERNDLLMQALEKLDAIAERVIALPLKRPASPKRPTLIA